MSDAEDPLPIPPGVMRGRTALVTGSNRGLGKAISRSLAEAGATVFCHARTGPAAAAAAAAIDGVAICGDLASPEGPRAIAAATLAATESLHVLVHNAAINPRPREALEEVEREVFDRSLAVNAAAPLFLTQLLAPALRRARPTARIVTVSSHVGRMAEAPEDGGYYSYRVSKAALNMVTRLLARDFADAGIRVDAIHPGWFRSEMGGDDAPRSAGDAAAQVLALLADPSGKGGGFWSDGRQLPW